MRLLHAGQEQSRAQDPYARAGDGSMLTLAFQIQALAYAQLAGAKATEVVGDGALKAHYLSPLLNSPLCQTLSGALLSSP